MSELLYQELELDYTGYAKENLIVGEYHKIEKKQAWGIVPHHGLYYADSLIIMDGAKPLDPGTDYYCINLHPMLTAKTGKPVCAAIVIRGSSVANQLKITYQAVGGPYATDNAIIANLVQSLVNDKRPTDWNNIFNKPSLFPPTQHRHFIADLEGWEDVVYALERIKQANTLVHVDVMNTILKGLTDQFECGELGDTLPMNRLVRHDDMLYFLSKRKMLGDLWVDITGCSWQLGRMNSFEVDTSSYPKGQPVYWQLYKERNAPIYSPIQTSGVVLGNGGIVTITLYVPSPHQHEEEKMYVGVKIDPLKHDFDAVTRLIQYKQAEHSDSAYGVMALLRGSEDDTSSATCIYDDKNRLTNNFLVRHRRLFQY